MPIKGDITGSSFAPQIRNFDNSQGSSKLKGGISEFIKAELNIRIYFYAEPTVFSIFSQGGEITRKDGKSFYDDGFQVDETFSIQYGFNGITSVAENATGTITAISEDGFTLFTTLNSLTNGNYDASFECLICGTSSLTECIYRFGLIENEESFNTFSKLTGDDQKFYVENINFSSNALGQVSGNIKGWADESEVLGILRTSNSDIPINRDANFGGAGGTVITGTVLNYRIQHTFPILPYYTAGQLENLQNLIPPNFLAGNNSLKYVFETTFKKNISDEEDNRKARFQSLQGSVGFYDENFNGFQSQYSVTSVNYEEVSSGNSADSIIVDSPTRVTILLNSADGTFTNSTRIVANHSYLPQDDDEYKNSQNFANQNFASESIIDGGSGSIITSVVPTLVSANELQVVLEVDTSSVVPDLTAESFYLLSLIVEDETLTQDNSDRVPLLVDVNTYDKSPDIPDLFLIDEAVSYNHVTDDTNTGFTDYKGWIQDGYEVKGGFRLDRSKFAFLSNLFIELVAWKDGTNEFFTIQSNKYNLTNSPINGEGNQDFNIQQTQGFKLDELDQFNKKDLTTGTFDGTFVSYNFAMGLKVNWQDWLSLPNADNIFVNVTQPNNGLNQNSSNYSLKEGYTLQTILRAEVLETQQQVITEYIHKIPMTVNDFEEDASEDWSATITTQRDDTGADANGKVLGSGKSTRIKVTFTPNFSLSPVLEDYEGIIRIVEQLPQGDKTIFELSSVRSSQANNLLIPLEGEALTKVSIDGSSVVLECRTDKTIIQDINYSLSGRLFGPAEVILGDFNDDFNNDFFV